jgi:hypothetical protein
LLLEDVTHSQLSLKPAKQGVNRVLNLGRQAGVAAKLGRAAM